MTVKKYLDLSTAHMTKDDSFVLAKWAGLKLSDAELAVVDAPIVVNHPYGWWVHVSYEVAPVDSPLRCLAHGFSPAFNNALMLARKHDCQWINFDQDADKCDELEAFSW